MKKLGQGRRILIMAVCVLVLIYSLTQLIGYFSDLAQARKSAEELRNVYYAETETPVAETPTPTENATAEPTYMTVSLATASPAPQVEKSLYENGQLPVVKYPNQGAYLIASDPFLKLKQKNQDIVGWLTIPDVVDDAVVQKNNSKYLTRDYLGNKNVNGALFLDETIKLNTRPYTLMIFGHNMKTGAMFGKLQKYRSLSYYRDHAFATCNTQYEDGRYVLFSVANIQVVRGANFVNLYALMSKDRETRKKELDKLIAYSVITTGIDVNAEDQLLVLVTCDGDEDERLVVTGRRLRDNETENDLKLQVLTAGQKR